MDESRIRAEQLLTLSSGARRVSDLVAAAEGPLHYEVMRHLLRIAEEGMIDVLGEAVDAQLVKRGPQPFTYVPYDDGTGDAIREALGDDRVSRFREQIASAGRRVFGE